MVHKGIWKKIETSLLPSGEEQEVELSGNNELVVATLNIGHGRGERAHQLFLRQADIDNNLHRIALALQREAPDIVALQEVDKAAFWSAMQDQLRIIGGVLGAPYALHGEHMSTPRLVYGTALLSKFAIDHGYSYTFPNIGILPPKGFVYGRAHMPASDGRMIHVVSLHLDFARKRSRQRQIYDLSAFLERLNGPVVVMGDFNSEWSDKMSAVAYLADRLMLSSYLPHASDLPTFPRRGKRWDWIIYSKDFEVVDYRNNMEELSDHRLVISKFHLKS